MKFVISEYREVHFKSKSSWVQKLEAGLESLRESLRREVAERQADAQERGAQAVEEFLHSVVYKSFNLVASLQGSLGFFGGPLVILNVFSNLYVCL